MLHFDLCTHYIVLESGETHSFVVETSKIFFLQSSEFKYINRVWLILPILLFTHPSLPHLLSLWSSLLSIVQMMHIFTCHVQMTPGTLVLLCLACSTT